MNTVSTRFDAISERTNTRRGLRDQMWKYIPKAIDGFAKHIEADGDDTWTWRLRSTYEPEYVTKEMFAMGLARLVDGALHGDKELEKFTTFAAEWMSAAEGVKWPVGAVNMAVQLGLYNRWRF